MDVDQILEARTRDLGSITVGRVLPAPARRSVGPFLFLDHMGPADAAIAVRPHPHIHLATVTYLFDGAIVHRDSLGSHQTITPGAINWMIAGNGIAHSERAEQRGLLHGLQIWVGLPRAHEDDAPSFAHTPADALPAFTDGGARIRLLAGTAFGATSPVTTLSPLFYAEVHLDPGAAVAVPDGYAERAAYVITGEALAGDTRIGPRRLAVLGPGVTLRAEQPTHLVLIGGDPLDGPRYIWWNFVSSSYDRIIAAAHDWRAGKFAKIPGDDVEYIPLDTLPPPHVHEPAE